MAATVQPASRSMSATRPASPASRLWLSTTTLGRGTAWSVVAPGDGVAGRVVGGEVTEAVGVVVGAGGVDTPASGTPATSAPTAAATRSRARRRRGRRGCQAEGRAHRRGPAPARPRQRKAPPPPASGAARGEHPPRRQARVGHVIEPGSGLDARPAGRAGPLPRRTHATQPLDEHRVSGHGLRPVDERVEHLVVAGRGHVEQLADGLLLGSGVLPPGPLELEGTFRRIVKNVSLNLVNVPIL